MKLGNLLKKELKELLTFQAIFSMIFICVLLIIMGKVMSGAMDEAINNTTVNIANLDDSAFTEDMIKALPDYGATPNMITLNSDDYYAELNRLDIKSMVIIPAGFGETAMNSSEAPEIKCVTVVSGGGMASSLSSMSAASVTGSINQYVRSYIEKERLSLNDADITLLNEPVITAEYTTVNGKTEKVPAEMLMSSLMTQSMAAPLAVFFLVMMASQMIMTAISTEKIDKTLETLLSAPVSRLTVLLSKMIAALIVALLNALSTMIGFVFYMQGMMGGAVDEITSTAAESMGGMTSLAQAMQNLGLTMSGGDMVIFGIDLFLTIAIGLSISLILGAMATDVKSVQTLTLPIMMATMIPFMVTMFTDVNSLSAPVKAFMYLIPFTHTYTAMPNFMFGHRGLVYAGLIYQMIFFAVCMYLAVRVFTTDLLFTMNFSADSGRKLGAAKKKPKTEKE